MGDRQPAADRGADLDCAAPGNRSLRDVLPQRPAPQELGDGIGNLILAPEVVDGEDVGMAQCTCGHCLTSKSPDQLLIARQFAGEYLDGHIAAEPGARPKNIARDVRTYLAAALGIPVSHQKISVAVIRAPTRWAK